jgi:hypothetical protein
MMVYLDIIIEIFIKSDIFLINIKSMKFINNL